jgi:hypothetical protein
MRRKGLQKKVLTRVLPEMKSRGFEFDVELLWRLKNRQILEMPIKWEHRGRSRFNLKQGIEMMVGVLSFLKPSRTMRD